MAAERDQLAAGAGAGGRVAAMVALRGVALLGIFCVNVQLFSQPLGSMFDVALPPGSGMVDVVVDKVVKACCEGRFYILFSMLFGAGLVLQEARVSREGRGFGGLYVRRLAALFCFGAAHVVLVWYGDILLIYSLCALPLLLLRRLSARGLLWTGAGVWLFYTLVSALFAVVTAVGGMGSPGGTASVEDAAAARANPAILAPISGGAGQEALTVTALDRPPFERVVRNFEYIVSDTAYQGSGPPMTHPIWVHAEAEAFKRGPFAEGVKFRLALYGIFLVFMLFGYVWSVIAMMFVGAGLAKAGFFGAEYRRLHVAMVWVGLGLGLPLSVLGALLPDLLGADVGMVLGSVLLPVAAPLMTCAYVGGIVLAVNAGVLRWLFSALAKTGRMAFTNYLCQSLVATFIMYHWGLGQFGEWSEWQRLALVFTVFAGQVVVSNVWLYLFRMGPLEWVWRACTYLERPRFLREGHDARV
jgi:uncharacterized protein